MNTAKLTIRDSTTRTWATNPRNLAVAGLVLLGLCLIIAAVSGGGVGRLAHSYLVAVCFCLSIALGALFFVALQHLTGAGWSVVVRRIAEALAAPLPVFGLLLLPILVPLFFGSGTLYPWNDADVVGKDPLIQAKTPYLNATFFVIRCTFYILVWSLMARFFWRNSLDQDEARNDEPTLRMRKWSGPLIMVYAVIINFAAFDLLMSLDPHWFSTIFGVYFFAGSAVAICAALPLIAWGLQRLGVMGEELTTEHYHDLAKLLFGFLLFWAYIAFSQFLLIWYANIPEETVWFARRQSGSWTLIGLLLIFGQFALPFCGLMSRAARRSRGKLLFWAAFALTMHWIDLFWLVLPQYDTAGFTISLLDPLTMLGVGLIYAAATLRVAAGTRLVPKNDPLLAESLAFHNL
jgi:hypothetical protein